MRFSRAVHLVMMVGLLSSLLTICLWSTCGGKISTLDERKIALYKRNELLDNSPSFVRTEYHKRGTNSIDPNNAKDEEEEEEADGEEEEEDEETAEAYDAKTQAKGKALTFASEVAVKDIACKINGEKRVNCKKMKDEVYLPWSFVKPYFEVFGDMQDNDTFDFHHANSIVHPPQATYGPGSMFMAFDHYTVETRDRVKCITASEGVPITTQWNSKGYHYPIQVAQYGLSHHAKHLVNGEPDQLLLEDGEDDKLPNWVMPDKKSEINVAKDSKTGARVVEFITSDSLQTKGIALPITEKSLKCLSVDVRFSTNGSLSVVGELSNGERIRIHFVFSRTDIALDLKTGSIYYGLGERRNEWIHLARELKFDVMKGFLQKIKMERVKNPLWFKRILEIRVHGHGWLDNLTLSSDVHMDQFFASAKWLVKHQDERGGWPIMVTRRLVTGVLELPPGWYSAMGQGQAMSVLARAYTLTKDRTYLDTAVRALRLFEVDSAQGGVRARFLGKLDWYEEYPTVPSSFVLNGFIYSLLGLYDLKLVADGEGKETAERIYNSGMTSLKTNIGMYDTGQGTFYDLRHISAGIEPNRARWDYHTTHINQVLQLMVIDDSKIFKTTVHRWLGYLKGKRSRHN
ncbi:D-glucuronyl c5-epimerase [Plakobranchus ocellatus]|uniref:heparosan-N-sulfate-glucuronate 5-epimerase n=1 Tax=Plakobranchus ocellatus TaxID=259542 RepID=A0AAV4AIH9_9GAST|nr:D-glucuronyl c5-epimerase [Plakobranchus ocellatus]